jgi:vacuolar protein sorting-associated protein 13A/C
VDNLASYAPVNDRSYYYWASFLNGRQRTVLFTRDLSVATIAKEAYEVERMEQQVELSLRGIGLSLVNNAIGQEILYMGMSCSGIVWEQKVRSRYRSFAVKIMTEIEDTYQAWIEKGRPDGFEEVDNTDLLIDFSNMIMKRKGAPKKQVYVRRSFQNGLYLMYRKSPHQTQIHMKLNHLQIDNQVNLNLKNTNAVFSLVECMCLPMYSCNGSSSEICCC